MRRELLVPLLARVEELGLREVTIIGSQALHATTDAVPAEVLMSIECDLLLDEHEPVSSTLDVELGPESDHRRAHGIYIDTVNTTFPFLPAGYEQRLVPLVVGALVARCLEPHDLVLSKLAAGRLKDYELIAVLIDRGLVELDTIRARIGEVVDLHMRAILLARLQLVLESKDR